MPENALSGENACVGPRRVALLELLGDLSPRQVRINDGHVTALEEVIDRLPPIIVDQGSMKVIDGVHRLEAFRRAGRTHIDAMLFTGSDTQALILAIEANVRHGQPLNAAERRAGAERLLKRCPERSDRWLATVCGLSHTTVAHLRRDTETPSPSSRIGLDGRRRPINPAEGRAGVEDAMLANPSASLREVAEAAGVAVSTARRVAARRGLVSIPGMSNGPSHRESDHDDAVVFNTDDPAFQCRPELVDTLNWMRQTSVYMRDFPIYMEAVPYGRIYELVDEFRRRSEVWAEMARSLEQLARQRRTASPS